LLMAAGPAVAGSPAVEVHWDALSGASYKRAGDDVSDFSPADAGNGIWQLFGSSGGAPELGFIKLLNTAGTIPPPQPAVERVVQTQALPVPAQAPASRRGRPRERRRVRATFVIGWTWNKTRTRLHRIRVTGVPRDARIEISCAGRGCPESAAAAGYKGLDGLLRSLAGRVFRAGDLLTITVTAPNKQPQRIGVRIRDGALPKARLL